MVFYEYSGKSSCKQMSLHPPFIAAVAAEAVAAAVVAGVAAERKACCYGR